MTDNWHFERLLAEFKRVGVDPDTFSAVLAVRPEEAMRALESLPADAGPAAFLAKLREIGVKSAGERATPPRGHAVHTDRPDDVHHGRTGT